MIIYKIYFCIVIRCTDFKKLKLRVYVFKERYSISNLVHILRRYLKCKLLSWYRYTGHVVYITGYNPRRNFSTGYNFPP